MASFLRDNDAATPTYRAQELPLLGRARRDTSRTIYKSSGGYLVYLFCQTSRRAVSTFLKRDSADNVICLAALVL